MSINYTEKGVGLHEAVSAAGHTLWCLDGVWRADDEAAVQKIIDGFNPYSVSELERQAEKAVLFGRDLADKVAKKVWAMNTYLANMEFPLTAEEILDLLKSTSAVDLALRNGALHTARGLLADIKTARPEYTDAILFATASIDSFLK
jgi:hypothetical protein